MGPFRSANTENAYQYIYNIVISLPFHVKILFVPNKNRRHAKKIKTIRTDVKWKPILKPIIFIGPNVLNFPNHVQQLLVKSLHNFKTEMIAGYDHAMSTIKFLVPFNLVYRTLTFSWRSLNTQGHTHECPLNGTEEKLSIHPAHKDKIKDQMSEGTKQNFISYTKYYFTDTKDTVGLQETQDVQLHWQHVSLILECKSKCQGYQRSWFRNHSMLGGCGARCDISGVTYLSSCINQLKVEVLTVHIDQFVKRCQRESVALKTKKKPNVTFDKSLKKINTTYCFQ